MLVELRNSARLVGFEVELVGKRGARRRDLALRLAAHFNGRVQSGFRYLDAGVCETRPRLPTLECRVLPASVDAAEIMRHLDRVESFLDEVARRADG